MAVPGCRFEPGVAERERGNRRLNRQRSEVKSAALTISVGENASRGKNRRGIGRAQRIF